MTEALSLHSESLPYIHAPIFSWQISYAQIFLVDLPSCIMTFKLALYDLILDSACFDVSV